MGMGMGMDMGIIMEDIIHSVLVAARMLHTVSGAFVSATVGTRRDMADVNRTGQTNKADQITSILLLSVWRAPPAKGWT